MSSTDETMDSMPKCLEELSSDPIVRHFDRKTLKAREIIIFMEESKIWQGLLADCIGRAGVNAGGACRQLQDILGERIQYYNSKFNPTMRPVRTPGIPKEFEPSKQEAE